MNRWSGKVVIVTGASGGIGAAISEKLVANGLKVVGLARRLDKLQELKCKLEHLCGEFHPFQADITHEDDIKKALNWIKSKFGGLNILINNAGISKPASLLDGTTELFRNVIETNILALAVLTRESIKIMRDFGEESHIIHINSNAGHRVNNIPLMNVYFASKFAVTALAETLRLDLVRIGSKIRVTSVSPGLVETDMINDYLAVENLGQLIQEAPKLKPEDVANAVIYVLGTPSHVQVRELIITPTGSV